jgi:restriction endonuclease S subunit
MFGDPVINNKDLPSEPLGELCNIFRGGSPRPIEKYLGGTMPWVKIGDATSGDNTYLHSTKDFIIEEGVKKSRFVKAGSLIFANCGVSLGFARIITFNGCIHDGWLSLEDIDERLSKEFLLQSLNHCTEFFRATAPDGTQPNLNIGIMKSFLQIIPSQTFQKRFVDFFQQVEKSKLEMQKAIHKEETLHKSLMQKCFRGDIF